MDEPDEPAVPPVEGDADEPLDVELPVPVVPLVPPLVDPPVCANAAPAASIEITATRFHHVFIRNRSRDGGRTSPS